MSITGKPTKELLRLMATHLHDLALEIDDIERGLDAAGVEPNQSLAWRVAKLSQMLFNAKHGLDKTYDELKPQAEKPLRLTVGQFYHADDGNVYGPVESYRFPERASAVRGLHYIVGHYIWDDLGRPMGSQPSKIPILTKEVNTQKERIESHRINPHMHETRKNTKASPWAE